MSNDWVTKLRKSPLKNTQNSQSIKRTPETRFSQPKLQITSSPHTSPIRSSNKPKSPSVSTFYSKLKRKTFKDDIEEDESPKKKQKNEEEVTFFLF
jgi:hypothetical protein